MAKQRSDEVVVLSNDVVPGMGMPVAAPGLRAWGIARGLRAHGLKVRLVVVQHIIEKVWPRSMPPPLPPMTTVMRPEHLAHALRRRTPRALVLTNSNHAHHFLDLPDVRFIYDFFAPKLLELTYQAGDTSRSSELDRLRSKKLAALERSDGVIVNGAKKMPYVMAWLLAAGVDVRHLPLEVVNMPVPSLIADGTRDGPVKAVISGYLQAWSRPGAWVDAVTPFLDDGSLELDLLVADHWGTGTHGQLPEGFDDLAGHGAVRTHGTMTFGDFQDFLSTRDLTIDVFARNRERELAMVTRTAVALGSGVPALHVPFTECSGLIHEHAAGWLTEPDDPAAISRVLETVTSDRACLVSAREGARSVARNVLDPKVATRPLVEMLERLG